MLAKHSMTTHPHCAHPKESAESVHARMTELDFRHMPVVVDGDLVGILSDRDLLLHAHPGRCGEFPEGLTAGDIMSKEVVTARGESTLAEIAQKMLELKIDSIPITRADGTLVGIVTSSDLLRLVAGRDANVLSLDRADDFLARMSWDHRLDQAAERSMS